MNTDLFAFDHTSQTPLLVAVSKGHLDIVKVMLERESEFLFDRHPVTNQTLMSFAISCGKEKIATYLAECYDGGEEMDSCRDHESLNLAMKGNFSQVSF